MKTAIFAAAAGLLLSISGSAHAAVYSFSGSDAGRSITGSITYDPTTPIESTDEFEFGGTSLSYPGVLSFKSGNLSRSSDYLLIVADAFEGNADGYADGLNAFVPASSRENYSLSFDYPDASFLTSTALPSAFPTGAGQFFYSYAGDEFSIPVTLMAAVPAVPEAATWAMMIMGFGFIGFAMRRRQADHGMVPALAV